MRSTECSSGGSVSVGASRDLARSPGRTPGQSPQWRHRPRPGLRARSREAPTLTEPPELHSVLRIYANKAGSPVTGLSGRHYTRWVPVGLERRRPGKSRCLAHIPLDFAAKASIAVGIDGLLLGRRPPGPIAGLVAVQASRQARCGDGERGHGHQANQQASEDQDRG